jgi:hypothetical protein
VSILACVKYLSLRRRTYNANVHGPALVFFLGHEIVLVGAADDAFTFKGFKKRIQKKKINPP